MRVIFGLVLCFVVSVSSAARFYTVQELPWPYDWEYTIPTAINIDNVVVGNSAFNESQFDVGIGYGVIWSNATNIVILDQNNDGLFGSSRANDINDLGYVVGNAEIIEFNRVYGAYWYYSTWLGNYAIQDAQAPYVLNETHITSINEKGNFVGYQKLEEYSNGSPTGVFYTNMFMADFEYTYTPYYTQPIPIAENQYIPESINENDQYVGTSDNSGFHGDYSGFANTATFLKAVDINNNNSIVGVGNDGLCKYNKVESGILTPISFGNEANDSGFPCIPAAINDNGVIVGHFEIDVGLNAPRAFIYEHASTPDCFTGFRDLNDFTVLPDGVVLDRARDINNNDFIVASGIKDGVTKAYILTPATDTTAIPVELDGNLNGVIDACDPDPAPPIDVAVLIPIWMLLLN